MTNFEIQKYDQMKPRFNDVYSRENLPKIKDGAYLINIETHWVALNIGGASPRDVKNNDVTYFDFLGVEHIPKEIKVLSAIKKHKIKYFQNTSI